MVQKQAAKRPIPVPVDRTKTPPPVQPESPAENPNELALAAATIFSDGNYGTVQLRDGRTVKIRTAQMQHIGQITQLFKSVVEGIDKNQFGTLLTTLIDAQTKAMEMAGGDVRQVSLNLIVAAFLGISGDKPIDSEKLAGNGKLLLSIGVHLMGSCFDHLCKFTTMFVDLDEDSFRSLDIDEGTLVVTAVLLANYSFFSKTLPQITKAFLAAWATEQRKANPRPA